MYENRIMEPIKNCKKGGYKKNNRAGKFDKSTLYAYMETSQKTLCTTNIG
jgi:hypothetical protein